MCPSPARTCRDTGRWIDEQDFAPAYAYLHRMLQFLQWQKRQAARHRLAPDAAGCSSHRRTSATSTRCAPSFPDLHVVHMHRDPRETIPSGASLNATLHAMHSDRVDRAPRRRPVAGADGLDQ